MVVAGVVLGLLVLLYGEASGGANADAFIVGGGVVVLASVGVLTAQIARTGTLPEGDHGEVESPESGH